MATAATVRFAEPQDIHIIVELCSLHAEYERADYSSVGKVEALKSFLFSDLPTAYCLLAELNGEVIGYATYAPQFSTWDANFYIYMDCLFLREVARGNGIGELLIDRIKKEARKLNCALIQWQTPDFNERAIKFYRRIGATQKAKERFFLTVD